MKNNNSSNFGENLAICICIIMMIGLVCFTFIHNDDVKDRNKQLDFCLQIYNSDNVVLEQCKEYFVILGTSEN